MVRQHVNPLSRFHQLPRTLPRPADLFADPCLPLHLDIGSARGRFLLGMAALHPERNHLGLEIRQPLVDAAEADRRAADLANLRFLYANANVSLPAWLAQLPAGRLELVTIQFPDPWFKKRHHKRRLLQPPLLLALAAALAPGRRLFLQSDVAAVIEPMVAQVEASGCFHRPPEDDRPWRADNPLEVPTERERQAERQGLPLHRVLYLRNGEAAPPLSTLEEALEEPRCSTDNPGRTEAPSAAAPPPS